MVIIEHKNAVAANPKPLNSAHEGYTVILEELDELWDEIKKKDAVRSKDRMLFEARQVAAMAIRFMVDVILQPELDGLESKEVKR